LATVQVTESSATLAILEQAEQAIDNYVGFQTKHIQQVFRGEITALSGSDKTIIDTSSDSQLHQHDNYFKRCVIEIIHGTGEGQARYIESSDYDNYSVTITDAWDTVPDTTSAFKIYQLGKFPRIQDIDSSADGLTYYKSIPQVVKDAVIAQVQFIVAMGDSYFKTDESELQSETTSKHSWSKGSAAAPTSDVQQISPRVRALLKGITNRTGNYEEGSSWPSPV